MDSFRDTKNKLWIACSECERGGNGKNINKCCAGGNIKRFNNLGCFMGDLMEKYKIKKKSINE